MNGATLTLAGGDCRVLVAPEAGGAVARFTWRGVDLLRPAPESAIREGLVRDMACYPLVPYSNRIASGRFEFAGRPYALRPNFPPEPHAIHGVGWQRPWVVVEAGPARLTLRLEHRGDGDWPFAFEATQRLELAQASLEWVLSIENSGHAPMPAGLGFHPFFPAKARATLRAPCQGVWLTGPDKLPASHVPVPAAWDFSVPRPAAGLVVDHCFTGWSREAVLDYGDHQVTIRASEALGNLVCFAPGDGRDFVALEPVSHASGAFALAEGLRGAHGLRVLAPGERLEASMTISARA